jgi:hypothetical protein
LLKEKKKDDIASVNECEEKIIENGDSNTDNTEKEKNKNIGAQFFDFLTAHTKQITILIGRLKSILF